MLSPATLAGTSVGPGTATPTLVRRANVPPVTPGGSPLTNVPARPPVTPQAPSAPAAPALPSRGLPRGSLLDLTV